MAGSGFRSLPEDPGAFSNETLPLDPSTLTGNLSNGLRYYIGHAAKPKDRVAMALAVSVGSVVEEEHERGVAHILEHLAFNATEKYSSHAIVAFLESIGAEFGACQNAHTGFDETVYELLVPLEEVGKGLSVLAQFAAHIRCDAEDLRKERGAVLDEWRGTRSAEGRAVEAEWRVMCADCKYADRLPIGLESVIRIVSAETIKAFYKKWYTTENMAVILMGDISDARAILSLVEQHLGDVPSAQPGAANRPERILLPSHQTPRYHVFVDKENQETMVQAIFQREAPKLASASDLRDLLVEKLAQTAFTNRLFKISRRPDPPFYAAVMSSGAVTNTIHSSGVMAVVQETGHELALESVLLELARVQLHGFSQQELDAAVLQEMAEAESLYKERDQSYATDLRAEYVRHFVTGELIVGREREARLTKTILKSIKLEDLAKEVKRLSIDQNCVIKATSSKRVDQKALERAIGHVEDARRAGSIEPWISAANQTSILESEPEPGGIVSSTAYPHLDAKELTLENGMKVCFKSTTFLGDQVLISGTADGGLSELDQQQFRTCTYAFRLASEIGQFGIAPEILTDILMGKRVELSLAASMFGRAFSGEQSPTDLKTTFQLVHRLFTHEILPSHGDLTTGIKFLKEVISNEQRNPMTAFFERVRFVNRNKSWFYEPQSVEAVDNIDSDVAFKFFNDCFKNPAQFTVCITGSIQEDELVPLVRKYLASIPRTEEPIVISPEQIKATPDEFPSAVITEDVRTTMIEPQGLALITVPVSLPIVAGLVDQTKVFTANICANLLETRLLKLLRFEAGEVYNVSARINWRSSPSAVKEYVGELGITFTCNPAAPSRLTKLAFHALEQLQENECEKHELEALLSIEQREWEGYQEENSFWHTNLVQAYASRFYRKTGDLDATVKRRDAARLEFRENVSPETIQQGFREYLPCPVNSRYTAITFSPRLPFLDRALVALSSREGRTALFSLLIASSAITALLLRRLYLGR